MPGVALSGRAFIFGKLPRHGDFVARGLDSDARAYWDEALSDRLARAREAYGTAFVAAHEASLPWRFISGPGPLGPDWRVGVVSPSVDGVGREFFIVVGVAGLSAPGQSLANALAENLEIVTYDGLQQAWDADDLTEAAQGVLERVTMVDPTVAESAERWWRADDLIAAARMPDSLIEYPHLETPVQVLP